MIKPFRCSCAAPFVIFALAACGSSSAGSPEGGGAAGSLAGAASAVSGASGAFSAGAGGSGMLAGEAGAGVIAGASGASAGTSGAADGHSGGVGGCSAGTGGTVDYGGSAGYQPWPGGNQVVTVDPVDTYQSDLSGLHYQAAGTGPAVLWGAQNAPSKLYRLLWNGTSWASDGSSGWGSGKTLRYPNGQGAPDSEGVTRSAAGGLYVSSERNNDDADVSRLSVLQYDATTAASTLAAVREWNLTADLPKTGANLGLEAIAWVPDSYLVSSGFSDENKKSTCQGGFKDVFYAEDGSTDGHAIRRGSLPCGAFL